MKQKQVHLGIRITAREKRWYQTAAKCHGMSLSEWARNMLLMSAFRRPAEDHPAYQEITDAQTRDMNRMTDSESLELGFALSNENHFFFAAPETQLAKAKAKAKAPK